MNFIFKELLDKWRTGENSWLIFLNNFYHIRKKTLCVITTWNWKHLHDTQKKNAWNENVHTVNNRDLILKPGIISTYLGKSIAFIHAQKYYYFVWHFLFINLLCAIFQVPGTCSQSVQLKIRCQFFGSDVFFCPCTK